MTAQIANVPAMEAEHLIGKDIVSQGGYVYALSQNEKSEVDIAMVHFKGLGLDGDQISPSVFPLPSLGKTLGALAVKLHTEQPFFILRGLDPRGLTSEDTILRYLGISSFLADKIGVQNGDGDVFAHIREAKYALERQEDRPIRDSTLASHFHTDEACDILAMHISGQAEEGGRHIVASSQEVYNILRQTRPDAISTLMAPIWHFDTRGRLTWRQPRPLLYEHQGHVIFNFNRQALQGVPGIEPLNQESSLSLEQLEALDAVEAAAKLVQIPLETEIGDIVFVNNFSMMHAREGFRDSRSQTRHLIRMWLKNSDLAYELPPPIAELNGRVFDESIKRTWNLLPKARLSFTVAERFSP